ncbi:MAG: carbon-nitrogen hydrolase family protein [Acidilobaceae archaeon]|nr:carbon-nitrogen hydrolase family protein [Acidilobaceae archaeon]
MKICVIHEKLKLDAKRSNAKKIGETIKKLRTEHKEVKVIVLPAYPFTGPLFLYSSSRLEKLLWNGGEVLPLGQGRVKQNSIPSLLIRWAIESRSYIIAGPLIEKAGPRTYLSVVMVSPQGVIEGKYRKILVSSWEERAKISSGKELGIFSIEPRAKIGIFVDEDLLYPEIFRGLAARGVNAIIGFFLTSSPHIGEMKHSSGARVPDINALYNFLFVRSKETGLPIILVGSTVESGEGKELFTVPTVPVDPEIGVVESKALKGEEEKKFMIVEIDPESSRPRELSEKDYFVLRLSCRALEKD